ncbi:mitochondrial ribosomal protein L27 [Phyllostomus discolor]|uniref:Mitochondrial ribosomal protein L27 n=1 Tax=Phyllostomus discolor TaxID=89673 RepID=A0A834DWS5_9CHIR|nr:mitochondrial ribosomal protein L27 [Phyllostomus discolor]
MEGHYVHAGNILGTQRHFRWHPGAHVSYFVPYPPRFLFWDRLSMLLSTVIIIKQLHFGGCLSSTVLIPAPMVSHLLLAPSLRGRQFYPFHR